jgi:hypothetical protein
VPTYLYTHTRSTDQSLPVVTKDQALRLSPDPFRLTRHPLISDRASPRGQRKPFAREGAYNSGLDRFLTRWTRASTPDGSLEHHKRDLRHLHPRAARRHGRAKVLQPSSTADETAIGRPRRSVQDDAGDAYTGCRNQPLCDTCVCSPRSEQAPGRFPGLPGHRAPSRKIALCNHTRI